MVEAHNFMIFLTMCKFRAHEMKGHATRGTGRIIIEDRGNGGIPCFRVVLCYEVNEFVLKPKLKKKCSP